MMQSRERIHVQYFNCECRRSGTLWERWFKSCLVQEDMYLLELYRYIELNPVRAGMVNSPAEYSWSSYQINGVGKKSELCTPHPNYLNFGSNSDERLQSYRELFTDHVEKELLNGIREHTQKGTAIGNEQFKEEIEIFTDRRCKARKR